MATSPKTPKTTTSAPTKPVKVQSFDISRSDETLDLAKDLAKFIKDNKLTTQVQGKEFVNVEGWQYAGSRLGIVPIVEHVLNCSTNDELRYQAKVTLFDLRHGATVGAGFAVCSNKESGKKFYQEFAIMSMAQTRAIGKAYRNCLAWIIRAAGYEPTPAEEMDYNTNATAVAPAPGKPEAAASAPDSAPLAVSTTSVPSNARPIPQITKGPINVPEMRVVGTDEATPPAAPFVPAEPAKKEEIIRLLNHPAITRPEKTKMLLAINKLNDERATFSIVKLQLTIADREEGDNGQQWRKKLKSYLYANKEAIGQPAYTGFAITANLDTASDVQLLNALVEAHLLAEAANTPVLAEPAQQAETPAA